MVQSYDPVIERCDEASIAQAARVLGDRKPLDLLVNNAAIFPGEGNEPFERVDPDWFNEAFDYNVTVVRGVTGLPSAPEQFGQRPSREHFFGRGIDQREGGFCLLSLFGFEGGLEHADASSRR